MGYDENERGEVVLTISMSDWQKLLLALGYAAGAASNNGNPGYRSRLVELANRLNEGNPRFTPYDVTTGRNIDATKT